MIHFLYATLKFVFDFLIVGIIFKLIVGHWIAERIIKWFTSKNERNLAIWQHFVNRSYGRGHESHYVLDCSEGKCAKL